MTETTDQLPEATQHIKLPDKDIYIVGTAHVSKQSVDDVRQTFQMVSPDAVAVELCSARYKTLTQKQTWKNTNIFRIIREKKATLLLVQLILSAFYRRLGEKLDVKPGAEMLEAANLANQTNAELVLADRDIKITLKRVWGYLSLWNKLKMVVAMTTTIFIPEKIDEEIIEQMKKTDQLENLLETFAKTFPEVKSRLIDERDIYLARKIAKAPGKKIVAVVGAGHAAGIKRNLDNNQPLEPLLEVPPPAKLPAVLKWAIPAAIIAIFVIGFFKEGPAHSVENIYIWFLVNGLLSAIGAALALAHPLTIASAFFAAPLTSLNPFLAAGWVAGLVQAAIRKPKVADFENLASSSNLKSFWKNPVAKILLVVVLANLGSVLGTFIALTWLASRSL